MGAAGRSRWSASPSLAGDARGRSTIDEGVAARADVLFWAEAVRAGLNSHRRDLSARRDASLDARLQALEATATVDGAGDGV